MGGYLVAKTEFRDTERTYRDLGYRVRLYVHLKFSSIVKDKFTRMKEKIYEIKGYIFTKK